jgi:hypothetical protein
VEEPVLASTSGIEAAHTPLLSPSANGPFLPAQSRRLSSTDQPDFAGGPPPLDVILESFKDSITQQWQTLVNSYFPSHIPTSAPSSRIQTIEPHQTPSFYNAPAHGLVTRTQPNKRRYSEFQEQGDAVAYSAPPMRNLAIPSHSTGDVQRLRLKSPPGTPSLWAIPEARPVGRPRGSLSCNSRSRLGPGGSIMEAQEPYRSSPHHRLPSTASQSDQDEDELFVPDSMDSDSEDLMQEFDDSGTLQGELEKADHEFETLQNDAEPTVHENQASIPALARDGSEEFVPDTIDYEERTYSNLETIESRTSGRSRIVQSRRDSLDGDDEYNATPPPAVKPATHRHLHSSGGPISAERKKKPRALYIQALPSPKASPLDFHRRSITSVVPAPARSKAHNPAPKSPVVYQKPSSVSKPSQITERRKSDPGVDSAPSASQAEHNPVSRPRGRGRPRKSDGPNPRRDEAADSVEAESHQMPPPRRRGRPRKSDLSVQIAVEKSPPTPIDASDRENLRPRPSVPGPSHDIQGNPVPLQPRQIGRPYTSPWEVEDDIRLIDMITVQKLSLQKVYDSNLFPGKTIPGIVHRYYRVLGGPVRQVRPCSNPSMNCENCHVEYTPSKRVKLTVDKLCIACRLYAKAHGGQQRPLESHMGSTALDEA